MSVLRCNWLLRGIVALIFVPQHLAVGMNWEGHDDWLAMEDHAQRLKAIMPQPLLAPLPECDRRTGAIENNPYEQRPLPGHNCTKSKSEKSLSPIE
jgi:hypothetical protein